MRVLFAHGFEGGPSGSKPTYMREVLGWEVTSPIMSELGWDIESQTKVLLRCIDENDFDLVIVLISPLYHTLKLNEDHMFCIG